MTPAQLARLTAEWSAKAGEPVTVERIGGAFYAFGSELAALRLAYAYRHTAPDKVRATWSENRKSWFFRLETESSQ
jgi:hypothetical protein